MAASGPSSKRSSLHERLGSLLAPQTSADTPQSRPESPFESDAMFKPALQPIKPAVTPISTAITSKQAPVLRWLGLAATSPTRDDRVAEANPATEEQEAAEELKQALQDDAFSPSLHATHLSRPPEARIAPQGRPFRQPALLDQLARATLPTAGLTRPLSGIGYKPSFDPGPPLKRSDTRASLDSLRSLNSRDRGIQTSAPQEAPAPSTPTRWWFMNGNKKEVDELLDDSDKASTARAEAEHIRQKYLAPKNPIVFCHGLLGFDMIKLGPAAAPLQISHWRGIKEVLEENGVEVLITRVPATSSVDERARVLLKTVDEAYPGRSVHLIGHSMGGLDCRYLTSRLHTRKFKVLSVTTIATPHRGSYFANYFLETLGITRLPQLNSILEMLPMGGGDGKAFEGLTLEAMAKFNKETPDVLGVKYFSWGAKFDPGLLDTFKWPHSVVLEKEGPNDGLVSVASAQWGKYCGTVEDVNHLDLVGWINQARYKWAELTGKEIKFKPATFYLGIVDMIAKEVEGLTWEHKEERKIKKDAALASGNGSPSGSGAGRRKESSGQDLEID